MGTFIALLDEHGSGPSVAVKDLIDVAGVPTTAASRAVAEFAAPATNDAALLRGFRDADCRLIGKANLHELAFGTTGVNPWTGTPVNPLDAARIPGGSSSGTAVAVANGDADLGLGSDTGGSIRIPAAFCGVYGLKTTFGRISLDGVWPLAPSLDTVGPLARDVRGLIETMALLEPGFAPASSPAQIVGRLRLPGVPTDPVVDAAVDAALAASGLSVIEIVVPEWLDAWSACTDLLIAEAAATNAALLADQRRLPLIGDTVRARLVSGQRVTAARVAETRAIQAAFTEQMTTLFARVEILALPSVAVFPPLLEDTAQVYNQLSNPVNFVGLPALSVPIPSSADLPASLQLVGPAQGEELLVRTGLDVEAACGFHIDG